jgi:sugar phosphate isomerase/epimerase
MNMLHYGVSMGSFGGRVTPELADALRGSALNRLELLLAAIELDEREGGPSRLLLLELIAEQAVSVESLHLPFGEEWDVSAADEVERRQVVAGLLEMLERSLDFKARLVVLHAGAEPIQTAERPERLAQACRSIAELLPFLERRHLCLAVEYLPRTCLGNSEGELLDIVGRFDPERVGICLDLNHAMDRHAELPRMVAALADRLFSLHVSDYDGVDEKHWFPGQGIIDWPAVMTALRGCGRELYLFNETRRQLTGCDPIFNVRQVEESIRFLQSR